MVTQNMLRREKGSFQRKILFVPALDLTKCLTCAPISELPSNISTMIWRERTKNQYPDYNIEKKAAQ